MTVVRDKHRRPRALVAEVGAGAGLAVTGDHRHAGAGAGAEEQQLELIVTHWLARFHRGLFIIRPRVRRQRLIVAVTLCWLCGCSSTSHGAPPATSSATTRADIAIE